MNDKERLNKLESEIAIAEAHLSVKKDDAISLRGKIHAAKPKCPTCGRRGIII